MEPTNQGEVPKLSQVIQIDEGKIQEHLGEVVRNTVAVCAEPSGTNGPRRGRIRGRVPTSDTYRRKRAKSH
jgi:hypothetical protein